MAKLITSQSFLSDAIVAEKRANRDYSVSRSPVFTVDGEDYAVILDGHHSLAAALEDGEEPEFSETTKQENDAIGLLDAGDVDGFLAAVWHDSQYVDAMTRRPVW